MNRAELPEQPAEVVTTQDHRGWFARRLSSANPFYLLSAALVIHSTSHSLRQSTPSLPPGLLMGLILGYLVLLAGICIFIVRRWKVWEDARSIPLILVLLLLDLSLCLDSVLPQSRSWGVAGLLGCAAVAVFVSEIVIRGLRLRLPAAYRVPFYLQLLMCLLPGAVYAGLSGNHSPAFVRWALFGYAVTAGVSMLTLIPAARLPARSVSIPGCPWVWPIHPWSLFVVVWLCLGFRLLLLTLSFDPAIELDRISANERLAGIFSPFWLSPMFLGIGWLMLEAGQKHRNPWLRAGGLAMPIMCFLLALASEPRNPAARQFLNDWLQAVGSPLWCATLTMLAFYGMVALRGVPGARMLLVYSLLPLCVVQPQTLPGNDFGPAMFWPLGLVAAVRMATGIWYRRSWPVFEGLCWLIVGGWTQGMFNGWPLPAQSLVFDAVLLALLAVHFCFRDDASQALGGLAMLGIGVRVVASGWVAVLAPTPMLPGLAELLVITLMTAGIAWRLQEPGWWQLTKFAAVVTYITAYWEGWKMLGMWTTWEGLNQFVLGLLLLHAGVAWSAWKSRRSQVRSLE